MFKQSYSLDRPSHHYQLMNGYAYPLWQEGDKVKHMVMDDENLEYFYQKAQKRQ
jgi:hypothetical protein